MTDFEEFQNQMQALYANEDYAAALELATYYAHEFTAQQHLVYYWRIALSARLGDFSQTLALLQEVLQSGFWYGETLLRRSPSLKPLQGIQEFENLVALNRELAEQDTQQSYPVITLRPEGRCQSGGPPCPLLLGLHANAATALDAVPFWRPAASAGWLVAAPQSSQAMWKGAFTWDDRHLAAEELKDYLSTLQKQYAIDLQRTVLAGHSLGGEVAMWLALSGQIQASAFLAIGPAGPWLEQIENWDTFLAASQNPGLRGSIIVGETDATIPKNNIVQFVAHLNQAGIDCRLETLPGVGHEYHPDYDALLLRTLFQLSAS